jgi:protein SCO1/2
MRKLLLALAGLFAIVGCADDGTAPNTIIGLVRDEPLVVADQTITRVDEMGAESPYVFKAGEEKLLVVYFGFTNCPDLCPTTLADLRSAFRRIPGSAEKVDVAMVTVDPERDTADRLVPYLSSFVDDPVALRTEDTDLLERVEAAFLASSSIEKEATGKVDVSHTAATYVVDANGVVIVEWPFGIGADGMENDLRILLEDLG